MELFAIVQWLYAVGFWLASVLFVVAAAENWCHGQSEKAMQRIWRGKAWERLWWAFLLSGISMALT